MEGNLFIWVCVAIGIIGLLAEVLKNKLLIWVARFGVGSMLMIMMNCLLPQYTVDLNVYTMGFATVLGVPGVMTLYVIKMIL